MNAMAAIKSLDILKAENERNELRQVFQVENVVLVMRFMWCSNDRLLLKITPRLWMCEEGDGMELSMVMPKLCVCGFGEGFGTSDYHFRLFTVLFEEADLLHYFVSVSQPQ